MPQFCEQNPADPLLGVQMGLEEKFIYIYIEILSGLKVIEISGLSKNTSLEVLKSYLKFKTPVIHSFDIFYCPWCKAFQKSHYPHNVIVPEYIEQEKYFVCYDPLINQIELFPLSSFIQAFHSFYIITTVRLDVLAYEEILYLSVEVFTSRDYSKSLQLFYDEFSLIDDISPEYEKMNEDCWLCGLFRTLSYGISGTRMLYSQFLHEIGRQLGQYITEIGEEFAYVSASCTELSRLILKLHCWGDYKNNKHRVCLKLQTIICNEERLIQCLRNKIGL